MLDIALLGTGGMMPLPNRFLSSAMIRYKKQTILIDCGEGTQVTLKMLGWGFKNIDILCLTHFHADHVSGLPGFLHTVANSGKTTPLTIVGPCGLKHVVESLLVIARGLPFSIIYKEIEESTTIIFDEIEISCLFVDHRITCLAYSFVTKRLGKFEPKVAEELELPRNMYGILQSGQSIEYNGKTITPNMVMGPERTGFKITYCTDSRPVPSLVDFALGSDLFICEGIYGDDSKLHKAKEYKHMLFSEAANLAKSAKVNELWLTHYSPSLTEPEDFLHVATKIFPNSHLGYDRKTITLKYAE